MANASIAEPRDADPKIKLEGSTLQLSGRLTVADANRVKSESLRWIPQPGELTLDLRRMLYGDACMLQLFASMEQTAQSSGKPVRVLGPAPLLSEAWRAAGFSAFPPEAKR